MQRPRSSRTQPGRPLIAVVHTRESSCACHAAFLDALRELGLRGVEVCVEELATARDIIRGADLVLEHVDTWLGRASLRPLVRHTIESWGGRLAGSTAAAAHSADDKVEAGRRLAAAGLLVPRSMLAASPGEARVAASRLGLPAVIKLPFEHGSRGVRLCHSLAGVETTARRWLTRDGGPLLVEAFVHGPELAAAIIEEGGRPRVLPLIEVRLPAGETYSERVKWAAGPLPIGAARLDTPTRRAVERATLRGYRALGLRDYARFDLRLAPGGRPCFLEANARPSVEPDTELRLAASLAGRTFPQVLAGILAGAARRHGDTALARRLLQAARLAP